MVEIFRIHSRIVANGTLQGGDREVGLRMHAALLKHAAAAFGPRWLGPLQFDPEEAPDPHSMRREFYDGIVAGRGDDPVVILAATPEAFASQSMRTALYRNPYFGAAFPPILMVPDADAVRSGALYQSLQRLTERSIPTYCVDLLHVSGSAMPEALRVVTEAIARNRGGHPQPARWIVLVDPLYESKIGSWSHNTFFGQVRMERAQPIDGVGLDIQIEEGSVRLRAKVMGSLSALYFDIPRRGGLRGSVDWLAKDIATMHRVIDETIQGLRDGQWIESKRDVELNPYVERLMDVSGQYRSGTLHKDAFVDRTLDILSELRREEPDEAGSVQEFIASVADSNLLEPVALPDGAEFIETIGRPPAVQGLQ